MRSLVSLALLLLLSPLSVSAQPADEPAPEREPITIATVDGVEITDIDVEDHLTKSHGKRWRDFPAKKLAEAREDVREQHIRVLVIEAELRRRKIVVSAAERRAKIAEMRKELAKQGKRLDDVLSAGNTNLWFLERAMGGTVGLFKLVKPKVDDDAVKAFFMSHKVQFQPRWKVRQILQLTVDRRTKQPLPPPALAAAKAKIIDAAKALKKDGSNFAELIASHSNGPRARMGGELPWYGKINRKLPAPFVKAMIALETKDQCSKIIRTPYGWHILQLVAKYEPRWEDARQPCIQAIQESLMREVLAQAEIKRFSFTTGEALKPAKKRPPNEK